MLMSLIAAVCLFRFCSARNATWFNLLIGFCLFFCSLLEICYTKFITVACSPRCKGALIDRVSGSSYRRTHTHSRLSILILINAPYHYIHVQNGKNQIKLVSLDSWQKRLQILRTSRHVHNTHIQYRNTRVLFECGASGIVADRR